MSKIGKKSHSDIAGATNRIQCYGTGNQKLTLEDLDSGRRDLPLCRKPLRSAMVGETCIKPSTDTIYTVQPRTGERRQC